MVAARNITLVSGDHALRHDDVPRQVKAISQYPAVNQIVQQTAYHDKL